MSKLRATRAQVIAAAIIVVLAVALGGVGLYGMNARSSENGAQVLENMRLQAILTTAGSGAVDSVTVAAALSMTSMRASGKSSSTRSRALRALPTQPLILPVNTRHSTARPASAWARKICSKSSMEARLVLG